MDPSKQAVVIVGAGFAGLFTALHLRHQRFSGSIVLIDSQDRFSFKPLLYELLSGELPEETICPPYKTLLEKSDITFVQDTVTSIDLADRTVNGLSGVGYSYHFLVLTVGRVQGYRNTEGAESHAFPFRSWEDGKRLERHLRDCLQRAVAAEDDSERRALLTTAIVGGGPTGVEMAATLADLLPYWYEKLGGNGLDVRIVLLNHGKTILNGDSNAHLRHSVMQAFRARKVGVEIVSEASATSVKADRLHYTTSGLDGASTLETWTTIWTAGTALHPLIDQLSSQIPSEHVDSHGNPEVTESLQLIDFPEVFAAGDCVTVRGKPQPALAQVAYQQGTTIAHNLLSRSKGTSTRPANISLRGTLVKTGVGEGLADLYNKMIVDGTTGGLIRTAAYLELLPTPLRNFKATLRWLDDEIFRLYIYETQKRASHRQPVLSPREHKARRQVKILAILAPVVFLVATALALRTPPAERELPPTGTARGNAVTAN